MSIPAEEGELLNHKNEGASNLSISSEKLKCLKDSFEYDVNNMPTDAPLPKRRKVAIQHQVGEMFMSAQKRKGSSFKAHYEDDETSEASINVLCRVCKEIFAACKDSRMIF